MKRVRCLDCDLDTIKAGHYYMVRDELWAASGVAPSGGMLCLGCLEGRLGRELEHADFTAIVPRAWRQWQSAADPVAHIFQVSDTEWLHRLAWLLRNADMEAFRQKLLAEDQRRWLAEWRED
jgi:hypothetical protein